MCSSFPRCFSPPAPQAIRNKTWQGLDTYNLGNSKENSIHIEHDIKATNDKATNGLRRYPFAKKAIALQR